MEDLSPYDARIERSPEDGSAYLARGKGHMRNGSWALAMADFDKALTLPLDRDRPPSERGEHCDSPEESDCRLQLGAAKVEFGDLAGAEQDMDLGVKLRPSEPAYTARGAVRLLRGDLDGALSDLNRALELEPSSDRARRHRATCKERRGDLAAAESDLAHALQRDPFVEPARSRWVDIRGRLGKSSNPVKDIPAPRDTTSLYLRASALMTHGMNAEAVADLTAALAAAPSLSVGYLNRGLAYEGMRNYEAALADFRKYEELSPGEYLGPLHAGHTLFLAGRPDEGRAHFERARTLAPADPGMFYRLGAAHEELGRYEEAIAYFGEGLDHAVGPMQAWRSWLALGRGTSYRALGREDEARADFEAALAWDPQNEGARAALAR